MAFVTSSGGGDPAAADSSELLSFEQQLLASMQQNAATGSATSSADNPTTAQLYQQLLAQQLQQQPISPTTNNPQNDLIQQLASQLLVGSAVIPTETKKTQNPSLAAAAPQQLATLIQQSQQSGFQSPQLSALSSLLQSSPSILQSAALLQQQQQHHQQQQQTTPPIPSTQSNPLAGITSQLLQQQLLQRLIASGQTNLLATLLQNNPLLASQIPQIPQQQQQQQPNVQLSLLTQLLGNNAAASVNRLSAVTDMNQLAALLQQTSVPSQGEQTPTKTYDEFLLRQQLPGRLSAQNSSNSLLGVSGSGGNGFESPTSASTSAQPMDTSAPPSTSRQPSSDRLLNSAESVQDHISRLISENEAIVEPNPVLLKRRPYHRQSTSNSITSQTSDMAAAGTSSQRGSPGLFHSVPNHRLPTTRSQSMHESQMLSSMHRMNNNLAAAGGSLTSGQPVVRQHGFQQPTSTSLTCHFCSLKFPNDAGLKAHEFRCINKETKRLLLQKQQSQPQLHWNNSLLNVQQQQLLLLQQQKILAQQQQHQSNIAALVGGGAGVAPDPLHESSGRSSVPIGGNGTTTGGEAGRLSQLVGASSPPVASKNGTSSPSTSSTCSESRHPLKKRLLDSVNSSTSSPTSVTPIGPSTSSSVPNIDAQESQNSPAKIAKMDEEMRELIEQRRLLNAAAAELTDAIQQSTQRRQILQQLIAPIATARSPKTMIESILYCVSYVEANIADRMPYVLTIDSDIGAHFRRHQELIAPAVLHHTRPRNVTIEISVTRQSTPICQLSTNGHSQHSDYPPQLQNPPPTMEDERRVLLSLRNGSRSPSGMAVSADVSSIRSTHSTYWLLHSKERILSIAAKSGDAEMETPKASPIPTATATAITEPQQQQIKKEETKEDEDEEEEEEEEEESEEEEEEQPKPQKPDSRLTDRISKISKLKERPEEVEVYVRGRGRGRYVCERCGIRCKKPSMLKKHLKSHTNVRPYLCITCNFAFKTKGNLTKHLLSKAHRVKVNSSAEHLDGEEDNVPEEERKLMKLSELESKFVNDEFDNRNDEFESDNEDGLEEIQLPPPPCSNAVSYRRFGQENILLERSAHTPPSMWVLGGTPIRHVWSNEHRSCHSAPPAALCSPNPSPHKRKNPSAVVPTVTPIVVDTVEVTPNRFPKVSPSTSELSAFVSPFGIPQLEGTMLDPLIVAAVRQLEVPTITSDADIDGMNAFFANETQEYSCEHCERKYRKPSELHLHRQTHLIEQQQNARARTYQCPECKLIHRTKALLDKHIELAHDKSKIFGDNSELLGSSGLELIGAPLSDLSQLAQSAGMASTSAAAPAVGTNVRKYFCGDCDVGFRTHGVLAKHLRSKNHVKSLVQQGKLPEDALSLIKENTVQLASIDATDCQQAKDSLLKILEQIRSSQPADGGELECREQLGAASPNLPIGINTPAAGVKRKYSDRAESPSSRTTTSCTPNVRSRTASVAEFRNSGPPTPVSPVGSYRFQVHMNGRSPNASTAQSPAVNANVWMPPRPDQMDLDSLRDNVSSNRSAEEMSESTGRSESSTPIQRNSYAPVTPLNGLSSSSPIPTTTRCSLCEVVFESPVDLLVHCHADHFTMRDGTDYKCPRRNCDKVYPNRHSLRNHIIAHFFGGGSLEGIRDDGHSDNDSRPSGALFIPHHSPGAPEATHTVETERSSGMESPRNSLPHPEPIGLSLPCNFCSLEFTDARRLQEHWANEHFAQINNRPHVCAECDAGFTTADALRSHIAAHQH